MVRTLKIHPNDDEAFDDLLEDLNCDLTYKELIENELFVDDATYGLGEALFYAGDAAGAFKMMRQAQKLKHPNAKEFLEQHFGKQLLQIQEKILAQYATELPKNKASKLLQTCFEYYF